MYKVTQGFIRKFCGFPGGILENHDFGACPFVRTIFHMHISLALTSSERVCLMCTCTESSQFSQHNTQVLLHGF